MKVKDTQANTDRKLTWQHHCQIVSKERSITSDKKEHLILIQVQSSKKMRILNVNVPNNITSTYQYIKTDRNRKGVTAESIIPVETLKTHLSWNWAPWYVVTCSHEVPEMWLALQ